MLGRKRTSGRELARRLNVSQAWISYRLTGTQEIGLNDLQRIADALEVDVTDLLPTPARRSPDDGLTRRSPNANVQPRSNHLLSAGHLHDRPTMISPYRPVDLDQPATDYSGTSDLPTTSRRPVRLCGGTAR